MEPRNPSGTGLTAEDSPKDNILVIETIFAPSYIQTKHKNLRCFPKCAVLHAEQRFCGRAIYSKVYLNHPDEPVNDFIVFGELRNRRETPLFTIGDVCNKATVADMQDRVFVGQTMMKSSTDEPGACRFVLPPPRKWHYPGKLGESERHLCQLYLAKQGRIVATAMSTLFQISPIWKCDRTANEMPSSTASSSSPVVKRSKPTDTAEVDVREPLSTNSIRGEQAPILTPSAKNQRLTIVAPIPSGSSEPINPASIRTPPERRRKLPQEQMPRPFLPQIPPVSTLQNAGVAKTMLSKDMPSNRAMSGIAPARMPQSGFEIQGGGFLGGEANMAERRFEVLPRINQRAVQELASRHVLPMSLPTSSLSNQFIAVPSQFCGNAFSSPDSQRYLSSTSSLMFQPTQPPFATTLIPPVSVPSHMRMQMGPVHGALSHPLTQHQAIFPGSFVADPSHLALRHQGTGPRHGLILGLSLPQHVAQANPPFLYHFNSPAVRGKDSQ